MLKGIVRAAAAAAVLAASAACAGGSAIRITAGAETFTMVRDEGPTIDGVRYTAEGDPTTELRMMGRSAQLTVRGERYARYVLTRFSPADDELLLSVDGESFLLERSRKDAALYVCTADSGTYFRGDGDRGELYVRGTRHVAYDATPAPRAVEPPATRGVPVGADWRITSIGGEPAIEATSMTMRFEADGGVYGRASVNTYHARWMSAGSRVIITDAASTRMMGPLNFMEQEAKFFALLTEVREASVRGDRLTLTTRTGETIEAVREF